MTSVVAGDWIERKLYPPNAWGLYDMHGNVWEWVEDIYHESYQGAPTDGRAWIDEGANRALRVLRGGSWVSFAQSVRSTYRYASDPGFRNYDAGFRCARVQES